MKADCAWKNSKKILSAVCSTYNSTTRRYNNNKYFLNTSWNFLVPTCLMKINVAMYFKMFVICLIQNVFNWI